MNSCDEIQSKIESYIDNEISSVEKIHIEKHLLCCPKCMQKHAELFVLSDIFSFVEVKDVPNTFASNFHDKLIQEKNLLEKEQKLSKIVKLRNFAYAASFFFVLSVFARFGYLELYQKMYQNNQEKEMFRISNTITTAAQPTIPALSDSLEKAAPPQTNSHEEMGASSQDNEVSQKSSKNLNPNLSETNQDKTKKSKTNDSADSSKKIDFSAAQEAPIQLGNSEVVPKTPKLKDTTQKKSSSSTQSIVENNSTPSTTQKSSSDSGKPLIQSAANASEGTNQLSDQQNTEVNQRSAHEDRMASSSTKMPNTAEQENRSASSSAKIANSAEQENAGTLPRASNNAELQASLAAPTLVSLDVSASDPAVVVNQILSLANPKKWFISLDSPPSSPVQVISIPFATLLECESFIQTLHQSGIKGITKAPSNEDALVSKGFTLVISISKL